MVFEFYYYIEGREISEGIFLVLVLERIVFLWKVGEGFSNLLEIRYVIMKVNYNVLFICYYVRLVFIISIVEYFRYL